MKTKYIEIQPVAGLTKKEAAKEFSKRIWNLQRPDSVKDARDVTRYMFGVQPHPVNENDWVVVADSDMTLNKHTEALATELSDLGDNLSAGEKTALESVISSNTEIPIDSLLTAFEKQIIEYPVWSDFHNGHTFSVDDKVAIMEQTGEEEVLVFYKVIQGHSKQDDWSPENVPALFSKITVSGGIEEWSQPIGGDGRYVTGAIVTYQGKTYENTHTGGLNVWTPTVFGWTEVV